MENNNKELTISVNNALNAYRNTDENGRELLEHLFGKEVFAPKNIMERVKTFEDAVKVLGDNNASVNQYLFVANGPEMDETGKDLLAYLKLRIIAATLNEAGSLNSPPMKSAIIRGSISTPKRNWIPSMMKKEVGCWVGRTSAVSRVAVSPMRVRTTRHRTRIRATVLGSPSRPANWRSTAANNSLRFGLTL